MPRKGPELGEVVQFPLKNGEVIKFAWVAEAGKEASPVILQRSPAPPLAWRQQDPLLDEGFTEFEHRFKQSEQGDKIIPPIRIPSSYAHLVVQLAEDWSEIDKNVYSIGEDSQGRKDLAYSLYRNRREEHIATVFPHAYRNDEMVRVYSLEKADIFFQLLFEAKQREEVARKVGVQQGIRSLDPQGKIIKWPRFRNST